MDWQAAVEGPWLLEGGVRNAIEGSELGSHSSRSAAAWLSFQENHMPQATRTIVHQVKRAWQMPDAMLPLAELRMGVSAQ